jgi:hypothetical protein
MSVGRCEMRPTMADMIGFALIFAAAACVLVPGRPAAPAP